MLYQIISTFKLKTYFFLFAQKLFNTLGVVKRRKAKISFLKSNQRIYIQRSEKCLRDHKASSLIKLSPE